MTEAEMLLAELARRLDEDETVQWHREHDKLHDLYERTRFYAAILPAEEIRS